jgi:glutathione peroxidase
MQKGMKMWKCGCSKKSGLNAGVMVAIFLPVWIGITNGSSERTGNQDVAVEPTEKTQDGEKKMISKDVLGYEMEMLDGTTQSLEQYRGKVVLMVNVASKCGLTPQYKALEALYRQHKKEGLVIIGFPANDFNGQEPGTSDEIAQFCSENYDVTFPMTAKIHVKGKETHPLYKQLAAQPKPIGGEPEWNFAKFLVNRKGEVVTRFPSRTTPEDPALTKRVEELLAEDS